MNRRISTKNHGMLDYLLAATLYAAPRLLNWWAEITTVVTVIAGSIVIYSLLTKYEMGTLRAIPMQSHLLLDMVAGIALCVAPLLAPASPGVVGACVAFGIILLLGASFTPSYSPVEQQKKNVQPLSNNEDDLRHAA